MGKKLFYYLTELTKNKYKSKKKERSKLQISQCISSKLWRIVT